ADVRPTTSPFSLKSWAARSKASIKVARAFSLSCGHRTSAARIKTAIRGIVLSKVLDPKICWLIVSSVFCPVHNEDFGGAFFCANEGVGCERSAMAKKKVNRIDILKRPFVASTSDED